MGAGPPVWFPPSVKYPARPGSLLIQRRCRVLLGKAARSSRSVGVTPRSESATTEPRAKHWGSARAAGATTELRARQALGLSGGSRRDHRAARQALGLSAGSRRLKAGPPWRWSRRPSGPGLPPAPLGQEAATAGPPWRPAAPCSPGLPSRPHRGAPEGRAQHPLRKGSPALPRAVAPLGLPDQPLGLRVGLSTLASLTV